VKKEMMKISVILSSLLCWSFVSSNLHHEKSNDKGVGESNYINDGSDLTLAGKEYSDEASSGKDWGGDLNFLNRKVCLTLIINRNAINNK